MPVSTDGLDFERKVGLALLLRKLVPPVLILIPVYLRFPQSKLLDTWLGLTLTYTAFNITFCVWMMESFFREIQVDLEEGAMVDGDSRFSAFYFSVALLPQNRAWERLRSSQ